ncbi:MAG: nuclease [Marmoricola sp.]|nr:nuclease [Marmoricola sp.]
METQQTRITTRSDLNLSKALDHHYALAQALATGRANLAQAKVIVKALDKLTTTGEFAISAEQRLHAEEHLLGLALDHDAKALRLLGRHPLEVVAPDLAEHHDGKALEAEEAAALRRTYLEIRDDDEGSCHGKFRIPHLHGQMLRKIMLGPGLPCPPDASRQQRRPPHPGPARHRVHPAPETIPAKSLPRTGGCSATIVVMMSLDQLLGGLDAAGVCTLDTGAQITAAEARRLACTRLFNYLWTYNTRRIHSSLGYVSPRAYAAQSSICP